MQTVAVHEYIWRGKRQKGLAITYKTERRRKWREPRYLRGFRTRKVCCERTNVESSLNHAQANTLYLGGGPRSGQFDGCLKRVSLDVRGKVQACPFLISFYPGCRRSLSHRRSQVSDCLWTLSNQDLVGGGPFSQALLIRTWSLRIGIGRVGTWARFTH